MSGLFTVALVGASTIGGKWDRLHELIAHALKLHARELFDVREEGTLIGCAKGNRDACRARATGAADAVHVRLRDVRQIEVDDVREPVDVDAACGDVGCDEDATRAITEAVHRLVACVLRLVSVDGCGCDASLLEVAHEAIGAVLGAREHERALHFGVLEKLHKQRRLLLVLAEVELLLDALGGRCGRCHRDAHGVREQAVCKLTNVAWHRGREEERLTLRRQLRDEALYVGKEAHVEHAVRFVEDENLDVAKRELLLLQEIEKPSWRGHDDVDAAIELANLRLLIHAAEDDGVENLETLTVGREVLSNLCCELACGCDDEATQSHLVTRGRFESLKHRERESGGFAGSCLCASKNIAACKGRRNRLKLNGRRLRVAFFCDGLKNRGRETKVRKIHAASSHVKASTQGLMPARSVRLGLPGAMRNALRRSDETRALDTRMALSLECMLGRRGAHTKRPWPCA